MFDRSGEFCIVYPFLEVQEKCENERALRLFFYSVILRTLYAGDPEVEVVICYQLSVNRFYQITIYQ
jgi:hypothetical protein